MPVCTGYCWDRHPVNGCPGCPNRDLSSLDERFTPYYESGERIEVIYNWGDKHRFYVGKSTGWRPTYIELRRVDSSGGCGIFPASIKSIRGLGIYLRNDRGDR